MSTHGDISVVYLESNRADMTLFIFPLHNCSFDFFPIFCIYSYPFHFHKQVNNMYMLYRVLQKKILLEYHVYVSTTVSKFLSSCMYKKSINVVAAHINGLP
ncbi:unnamed protein product [Meganyctiphanes norvegica]|uniref:Uncharacterized protein n=1 Tax=Meganyctiphanes norvegica TaxID=48144 RepID=A0AAV2PQG4_MEGNR